MNIFSAELLCQAVECVELVKLLCASLYRVSSFWCIFFSPSINVMLI